MINGRCLYKTLQMTEYVAAFIAVLAAIIREAGIGRIAVHVIRLLQYLFVCHPISERNRAHAPAQGVEHEYYENRNNEFLNGNAHYAHYIIIKTERCLAI